MRRLAVAVAGVNVWQLSHVFLTGVNDRDRAQSHHFGRESGALPCPAHLLVFGFDSWTRTKRPN